MIDTEHLCPGCMQLRDHMDGSCPVCGYPEKHLTVKGSLPVFSILAGRYLLGCPLGKGGFGITYIAMDLPTEQIVAIKEFFPADHAVRDSDEEQVLPVNEEKALYFRTGMRSFSEEGRLLSLCASIPGIVPFREMLQANGTAYLVMDYIPGLSMRKYMKLQGGPFTEGRALKLMKPILTALAAMHQKGIIHRDISPENLILGPDQTLTLIDFGAAREFNRDEGENLTVILKRGYAPEEQYHSDSRQGPWSDLYAACAVLYHMLTGILPQEAAARAENDQLVPISRLNNLSLSASTCQALEKGLQVDPAERYADISALMKDLYPRKDTEMVEDGIAEKENKENSEATEEAASADTEGRKEESPEARKDMENIEDIREDSAKKEDTSKANAEEETRHPCEDSTETQISSDMKKYKEKSAQISGEDSGQNVETTGAQSLSYHPEGEDNKHTKNSQSGISRALKISTGIFAFSLLLQVFTGFIPFLIALAVTVLVPASWLAYKKGNFELSQKLSRIYLGITLVLTVASIGIIIYVINLQTSHTSGEQTASSAESTVKNSKRNGSDSEDIIRTMDDVMSNCNYESLPQAAEDVFQLWYRSVTQQYSSASLDTCEEIAQHARTWCAMFPEYIEELRIMNPEFTTSERSENLLAYIDRWEAMGKIYNVAASAAAAFPDEIEGEDISSSVSNLLSMAFDRLVTTSSDLAHSSADCSAYTDEFEVLRYLYYEMYFCEVYLTENGNSCQDFLPSNHPEALQKGLYYFLYETSPALNGDSSKAVYDVATTFWSGDPDNLLIGLGIHYDYCFGYQDFIRQGRAVMNEEAESAQDDFQQIASLASIACDDTVSQAATEALPTGELPDSYEAMDQIANLLYSWLQEEMLPKGYSIYSPEQGFLDYDADYDSVTAMIISDSGIYYGELSNGEISLDTVPYHFAVRSGYGIQFSIDDSGEVSIYRGNWENNSPNGEGTYYTQDYEKHCINGNWKDGKEDGTMTIAAGWKEEERTDVCEYEAHEGTRTFTGETTDDGSYIFARSDSAVWSCDSMDEIFGTAYFTYY